MPLMTISMQHGKTFSWQFELRFDFTRRRHEITLIRWKWPCAMAQAPISTIESLRYPLSPKAEERTEVRCLFLALLGPSAISASGPLLRC